MAKTRIVKQLRHGQITIPKELREALSLEEDDLLSITLTEGRLEIQPLKAVPRTGGTPWARELYELFEPVRRSLERYEEGEIEEAVEEAVRDARSEKA